MEATISGWKNYLHTNLVLDEDYCKSLLFKERKNHPQKLLYFAHYERIRMHGSMWLEEDPEDGFNIFHAESFEDYQQGLSMRHYHYDKPLIFGLLAKLIMIEADKQYEEALREDPESGRATDHTIPLCQLEWAPEYEEVEQYYCERKRKAEVLYERWMRPARWGFTERSVPEIMLNQELELLRRSKIMIHLVSPHMRSAIMDTISKYLLRILTEDMLHTPYYNFYRRSYYRLFLAMPNTYSAELFSWLDEDAATWKELYDAEVRLWNASHSNHADIPRLLAQEVMVLQHQRILPKEIKWKEFLDDYSTHFGVETEYRAFLKALKEHPKAEKRPKYRHWVGRDTVLGQVFGDKPYIDYAWE